MSYEPTQWATGDKITAAKMNKIENGIANGSLKVIIEGQTETMTITSHTWQEIYDAMDNGTFIIAKHQATLGFITAIFQDEMGYGVYVMDRIFYCSSPNGYPISEQIK